MTAQPRPSPAKNYTMADLQPIIDGKLPVPNLVEMDLGTAIGRITLGGWVEGGLGRARINPKESYGERARYYLSTRQFGGPDGCGIVLWSDYEQGHPKSHAASFAICVHEHVTGPGANHSRGWHPAYCGKCGLDMSIDSGD